MASGTRQWSRRSSITTRRSELMGYLYMVKSPTGKKYVGITSSSVGRRWRKHVTTALGPDPEGRGCPALNRAIKKYGSENFTVSTLVEAGWDYLVDLEQKAIDGFGTKAPNGYNLSDGGVANGGWTASDETRRRMSLSAKKRRHSEETKKKIGESLRGRSRPEHSRIMAGRKRPSHAEFMRKLWAKRREQGG